MNVVKERCWPVRCSLLSQCAQSALKQADIPEINGYAVHLAMHVQHKAAQTGPTTKFAQPMQLLDTNRTCSNLPYQPQQRHTGQQPARRHAYFRINSAIHHRHYLPECLRRQFERAQKEHNMHYIHVTSNHSQRRNEREKNGQTNFASPPVSWALSSRLKRSLVLLSPAQEPVMSSKGLRCLSVEVVQSLAAAGRTKAPRNSSWPPTGGPSAPSGSGAEAGRSRAPA